MKYRLLQWLSCPSCRSSDLAMDAQKTRARRITRGHFEATEGQPPGIDLDAGTETEVMDGALHCKGCGATYRIEDGIPRMLPRGYEGGPESAHRWTTFDHAHPQWEESFLDYAAPLVAKDFLGRFLLDAGCGYGRHAYFASRFGAEVVAIDSSADAVASCAANTDGSTRVHVVQGDLYRMPFKDELFDMVYCFGVLHHLDEPMEVFKGVGATLRSGGRLLLWVYGPRQGATLTLSDALRGVTTGLKPDELHRVSQVIAGGLRLFSHTPYAFLSKVPIAHEVVSHLPVHDHYRWPFEVVVADVYDRLRIPVKHWFRGEQLEIMMTEAGYADVQVTRRVRNTESFRVTGVRR